MESAPPVTASAQQVEALSRGLPGDRVVADRDVLTAMAHDDAEMGAGRAARRARAGPVRG